MSGTEAIELASLVAIGLLLVGMFITVIRLVLGPNLGDRILALDMITVLGAGVIAAVAVRTGFSLYIDIAIALALVSFLSTIALSRYLLMRASAARRAEGDK